MFKIKEANMDKMTKAAALETSYLREALARVADEELSDILVDIKNLETKGVWSTRIVDLMQRARLIMEADQMLARFDAA